MSAPHFLTCISSNCSNIVSCIWASFWPHFLVVVVLSVGLPSLAVNQQAKAAPDQTISRWSWSLLMNWGEGSPGHEETQSPHPQLLLHISQSLHSIEWATHSNASCIGSFPVLYSSICTSKGQGQEYGRVFLNGEYFGVFWCIPSVFLTAGLMRGVLWCRL